MVLIIIGLILMVVCIVVIAIFIKIHPELDITQTSTICLACFILLISGMCIGVGNGNLRVKEAIDNTYLDAIKGNNIYKAYISYKPIIVNNDTTFAPADTFYFKK